MPACVRVLICIAAIVMAARAPIARSEAYTVDTSHASPMTGLWWNAGESGWGATLTQQSSQLFVTLFVYDSAGAPTWYTVSCAISGNSCSGDLLRVRGGASAAAPWAGNNLIASRAGSMALTFTSNDSGSMSYSIDGVSAGKMIARQVFGPPAPAMPGLAGAWYGAIIESRSNCAQAPNNGNRATYGQYSIGTGAGSSGIISIALSAVTGLQCSYEGSFTTDGARLSGSGNLICSDGKRGRWQSRNMMVTSRSMSLELDVTLDTTETCSVFTVMGGSRL